LALTSTSASITDYPQNMFRVICDLFKFWEITDNISEKGRDIVAMQD